MLLHNLEESCPYDSPTSVMFIWTVVATFMYPIGIPLGIFLLLLYLGVPQMVRQKQGEAIFHQILQLYVHARHNTVGSKIALYVGGGGEHGVTSSYSIIEDRTENLYRDLSQDGAVQVDSQRLFSFLRSIGISGQDEDDVHSLFVFFDNDGNGELDLAEMQEMIKFLIVSQQQIKGNSNSFHFVLMFMLQSRDLMWPATNFDL